MRAPKSHANRRLRFEATDPSTRAGRVGVEQVDPTEAKQCTPLPANAAIEGGAE